MWSTVRKSRAGQVIVLQIISSSSILALPHPQSLSCGGVTCGPSGRCERFESDDGAPYCFCQKTDKIELLMAAEASFE